MQASRRPLWVNRVTLVVGRSLPVYSNERTSRDRPGWSVLCHNNGHSVRA